MHSWLLLSLGIQKDGRLCVRPVFHLSKNNLARDDGKRPYGGTWILCFADKAMAWDVMVVNTLAESYIWGLLISLLVLFFSFYIVFSLHT